MLDERQHSFNPESGLVFQQICARNCPGQVMCTLVESQPMCLIAILVERPELKPRGLEWSGEFESVDSACCHQWPAFLCRSVAIRGPLWPRRPARARRSRQAKPPDADGRRAIRP